MNSDYKYTYLSTMGVFILVFIVLMSLLKPDPLPIAALKVCGDVPSWYYTNSDRQLVQREPGPYEISVQAVIECRKGVFNAFQPE